MLKPCAVSAKRKTGWVRSQWMEKGETRRTHFSPCQQNCSSGSVYNCGGKAFYLKNIIDILERSQTAKGLVTIRACATHRERLVIED